MKKIAARIKTLEKRLEWQKSQRTKIREEIRKLKSDEEELTWKSRSTKEKLHKAKVKRDAILNRYNYRTKIKNAEIVSFLDSIKAEFQITIEHKYIIDSWSKDIEVSKDDIRDLRKMSYEEYHSRDGEYRRETIIKAILCNDDEDIVRFVFEVHIDQYYKYEDELYLDSPGEIWCDEMIHCLHPGMIDNPDNPKNKKYSKHVSRWKKLKTPSPEEVIIYYMIEQIRENSSAFCESGIDTKSTMDTIEKEVMAWCKLEMSLKL